MVQSTIWLNFLLTKPRNHEEDCSLLTNLFLELRSDLARRHRRLLGDFRVRLAVRLGRRCRQGVSLDAVLAVELHEALKR